MKNLTNNEAKVIATLMSEKGMSYGEAYAAVCGKATTKVPKGNEVPKSPKKATAKKVAEKAVETVKKAKGNDDMKAYEPKKGADGEYNWYSYDACRKKYCYFVATHGEVKDGKVFGTKWYGKIDFSENGEYKTAKKEFEKKFKYVKNEDR